MDINVQEVTTEALRRMLDSKQLKKFVSSAIDEAMIKARFNLEAEVENTIRHAIEDGKVL